MLYMTIKQFAEDQHVSYEAIRRQIVTYRKQLEGHIVRDKQRKLLDEYAVEFLRARRKQNPNIVINQSKDESIVLLNNQLMAAKDTILNLQQEVVNLRGREVEAVKAEVRYELLQERYEAQEKELQRTREALEKARRQLKASKEVVYERTIFGLYRKK